MPKGGARIGAGRKASPSLEFERVLTHGINRGLARAGELRGLEGSDIVEQVVEQIVADEVLRGHGWDVLMALPGLMPAIVPLLQGDSCGDKLVPAADPPTPRNPTAEAED